MKFAAKKFTLPTGRQAFTINHSQLTLQHDEFHSDIPAWNCGLSR